VPTAASILAGNPHEGGNCEYYGMDVDQRGEYFVLGGRMSYSYDDAEQAWRMTTNTYSASQWLGWRSETFANRQFRTTFQAKFLAPRIDIFERNGFKVYGEFHSEWVTEAIQNVGAYVSVDVVATVPNEGDGYHILLIFDSAPVDVLIKDFVMSFCDL